MKAMCPHCAPDPASRSSCQKCKGTGFIEVSFAEGETYLVKCTNPECGFENGGFICGPNTPYKKPEDRPLAPCIRCNSETKAVSVGGLA